MTDANNNILSESSEDVGKKRSVEKPSESLQKRFVSDRILKEQAKSHFFENFKKNKDHSSYISEIVDGIKSIDPPLYSAWKPTKEEEEKIESFFLEEIRNTERRYASKIEEVTRRAIGLYELDTPNTTILKEKIKKLSFAQIDSIIAARSFHKEFQKNIGHSLDFAARYRKLRSRFAGAVWKQTSLMERNLLLGITEGKIDINEETWPKLKATLPENELAEFISDMVGNISIYDLHRLDEVTFSESWCASEIKKALEEKNIPTNDLDLGVKSEEAKAVFVNMGDALKKGINIDHIIQKQRISSVLEWNLEAISGTEETFEKTLSLWRNRITEHSGITGNNLELLEQKEFLEGSTPVFLRLEKQNGDTVIASDISIKRTKNDSHLFQIESNGKTEYVPWELFDAFVSWHLVAADGKNKSISASKNAFPENTESADSVEPNWEELIEELEKPRGAKFENDASKEEVAASEGVDVFDDPDTKPLREKLTQAQTEGEITHLLSEILTSEGYLGKSFALKKDETTLEIGTRGKADYNVFLFKGIDTQTKTIILSDGNPHGASERISYDVFLAPFRKKNEEEKERKTPVYNGVKWPDSATFIEWGLWNALNFANHLRDLDSGSYGDLEFDAEKNILVDKYKKGSEGYNGCQNFIGESGHYLKIISFGNGKARIDFGKNFKEDGKKGSDGKITHDVDLGLKNEEVDLHFLAYLFGRFNLKWSNKSTVANSLDNNKVEVTPEKQVSEHTEHGGLKHAFAKASFHDLMGALKHSVDFVKKKFEHGNHLQEARIMLALGKKLGMEKWNNDWYIDLKSKVENDEKKLVTERVEELGNMGTPDRHKSIYESLMNDGSHDYEHWASALSMLEKHGCLYAWDQLGKLEGSFIYLKRIAGVPLDTKIENIHYRKSNGEATSIGKIIEMLKKNKEPVTEEALIREYCKSAQGMNAQIWRMVKKAWEKGIGEESTSGEKEAGAFMTLERRDAYAREKLNGWEYYHAIGAALTLAKLPGSAAKKHAPWFSLAIGNIPWKLNQDARQKLADYYKKDGRIHSPALLFMEWEHSQEKFRRVVLELAKIHDTQNGGNISGEFTSVLKAVQEGKTSSEKDSAIQAKIEAFWTKHGETLQPLLTGSMENPVLAYGKETNPDIRTYVATVKEEIGNSDLNDKEFENGTYIDHGKNGASFVNIHAGKLLYKIKPNPNAANIAGDKGSQLYLNHFIDSVKAIHSIKPSEYELNTRGNTEEKRKTLLAEYQDRQKRVYKNLHKEFFAWATSMLGSRYEDVMKHPDLEALRELGFYSVRWKWVATYQEGKKEKEESRTYNINSAKEVIEEAPAYKDQLDHDFYFFLNSNALKDPNAPIPDNIQKITSRIKDRVNKGLLYQTQLQQAANDEKIKIAA